jgi:hypothetical protein
MTLGMVSIAMNLSRSGVSSVMPRDVSVPKSAPGSVTIGYSTGAFSIPPRRARMDRSTSCFHRSSGFRICHPWARWAIATPIS